MQPRQQHAECLISPAVNGAQRGAVKSVSREHDSHPELAHVKDTLQPHLNRDRDGGCDLAKDQFVRFVT